MKIHHSDHKMVDNQPILMEAVQRLNYSRMMENQSSAIMIEVPIISIAKNFSWKFLPFYLGSNLWNFWFQKFLTCTVLTKNSF